MMKNIERINYLLLQLKSALIHHPRPSKTMASLKRTPTYCLPATPTPMSQDSPTPPPMSLDSPTLTPMSLDSPTPPPMKEDSTPTLTHSSKRDKTGASEFRCSLKDLTSNGKETLRTTVTLISNQQESNHSNASKI